MAVDPSAPFAAALRDVLPHATLVVDHWHLHRLANVMLTVGGRPDVSLGVRPDVSLLGFGDHGMGGAVGGVNRRSLRR